MQFLKKHSTLILYGVSLAVLFLLLKFIEYRLLIIDHSFEIYVGCIALLFTGLGIWLSGKFLHPKKRQPSLKEKG